MATTVGRIWKSDNSDILRGRVSVGILDSKLKLKIKLVPNKNRTRDTEPDYIVYPVVSAETGENYQKRYPSAGRFWRSNRSSDKEVYSGPISFGVLGTMQFVMVPNMRKKENHEPDFHLLLSRDTYQKESDDTEM